MNGYYITAIRGQRVAYLAGPFRDHNTCLGEVSDVRRIAAEIDPWIDFDAIGTCKAYDMDGKLNHLLPDFTVDREGYVVHKDINKRTE